MLIKFQIKLDVKDLKKLKILNLSDPHAVAET